MFCYCLFFIEQNKKKKYLLTTEIVVLVDKRTGLVFLFFLFWNNDKNYTVYGLNGLNIIFIFFFLVICHTQKNKNGIITSVYVLCFFFFFKFYFSARKRSIAVNKNIIMKQKPYNICLKILFLPFCCGCFGKEAKNKIWIDINIWRCL